MANEMQILVSSNGKQKMYSKCESESSMEPKMR